MPHRYRSLPAALSAILLVFAQVQASGAEELPTPDDSDRAIVTLASEIWAEHLDRSIKDTKDLGYKEQLCRTALRANPTNRLAIAHLIHSYSKQDIFPLAAASSEYALAIGVQSIEPPYDYFREELPIWLENEIGEIVNLSRFETLEQKDIPLNAKPAGHYFMMQNEIRVMLTRKGGTRVLLKRLAEIYDHFNDPENCLTITALLVQISSDDREVIDLHFSCLEKVDTPHLYRYYINHFSRHPQLAEDYLLALAERAIQLDMDDAAHTLLLADTEAHPQKVTTWEQLGAFYLRTRQYDKAYATLRHATTLPDHTEQAYLLLARIAVHKTDEKAMVSWLRMYRQRVSDDVFVELLLNKPFRRFPRLLSELQ